MDTVPALDSVAAIVPSEPTVVMPPVVVPPVVVPPVVPPNAFTLALVIGPKYPTAGEIPADA